MPSSSTTQYDVFVSYRWNDPDKTWVREQLVPRLRAAGLTVCLDIDDFVPGRDLILEMDRAGIESKHVLCIISPSYFEGNRMVHFESLAARRRDPSGQASSLIPFLFIETSLPDWVRGLIPIDWTDSKRHESEWGKLLRLLGGDNEISAPPQLNKITEVINKVQSAPAKVEVIDVVPLTSRDGLGFGWDIILANVSRDALVIDKAIIEGEHAVSIRGFMGMTHKFEFEILLETHASTDQARLNLLGSVYEGGKTEWGRNCSGQLQREFSTHLGHDRWSYTLSLPLYFSIPPSERSAIRLAFKPSAKHLKKEEKHGNTPALTALGLIKSSHRLSFTNRDRNVFAIDVSPEFLQFIAELESTS